MKKKIDLLEGPIAGTLAKLAFPIMGTSLIQMGYNLVDMIWIGKLGSGAVAAVGAAGMFMWLANGVTTIPKIGGQVTVAQKLGSNETEEAAEYGRCALSGILAAMGNTVTTFRVTTVGLLINLVLDPVLIFGIGPIPGMKVAGAATATVLAQMIVFVLYLKAVWNEPVIFKNLHLLKGSKKEHVKKIVEIGFPSAIQDALFSAISMVIARLVAGWGDAAVAVQKVGSQIESISWMMAGGFSTAVNAFIAQNYGAQKIERIKKGYRTALAIMGAWGIFTSMLLWIFPKFFFSIFITEPDVIPMGVDYLRIIGISELFMCLEGAATGAFQGLGKTVPPSVTGIVFNALRIPAAMLLSKTSLGLNGIWWVLSFSCVFKGTILPLWYHIAFKKIKIKGGTKDYEK